MYTKFQGMTKETKQAMERVWHWWTRAVARQPVFATLANALGVFTGLLGALYTDDIRDAFPFALGPYSSISIHAFVFWTAFFVFALTFLSREWSIDKQREASQRQLEETIRTMPPRDFVAEKAALDRIPLLILEDSLTASTDCQPGDLDPAMRGVANLALPVSAEGRNGRSEDGRRWRVLPGAPLTFFTQKSNSYGNAGELGKWCRERGDFSESVASQIDQYFGQDSVRNVIGSFASMPIKSSLGGNSIGVLNLHSNGLEMLTSAGAPSQFFPLAEPFTSLLADALQKLLKFAEKD